jgi:uncharacterized cofD-like protein
MTVLIVDPRSPSGLAVKDVGQRIGATVVESGSFAPTVPGAIKIVDLDTIPDSVDAASIETPVATVDRLSSRGIVPVVIGSSISRSDVRAFFLAGARDVIEAPVHERELLLRLDAIAFGKHRIACLGGGTGLYVVLSALKELPDVLLSSVVAMSDDGGSSGRLRASIGVLPPGDVRRSLVALSNAPDVMSYVMQYRFDKGGDLTGHSLGNLLLAALAERTGSMQQAVKSLGDVLNVQGHVMCVTDEPTTLCAEFEDGLVVRGEAAIDQCLHRPHTLRVKKVWHEPTVQTSVDVLATLYAADLIVIGPGDLYTSVAASLLVGEAAEAVRETTARRVYICNLMTKPGETDGFDAAEHVHALTSAIGADVFDAVLVSSSRLDPAAVHEYSLGNQQPVELSSRERWRSITRAEILERDIGDRSKLVRHKVEALRDVLAELLRRRAPSSMVPG